MNERVRGMGEIFAPVDDTRALKWCFVAHARTETMSNECPISPTYNLESPRLTAATRQMNRDIARP